MVTHPIRLRGLNLEPSQGINRPTILQRTEPDFIPAVLQDLRRGLSTLTPTLVKTKDDVHSHALKLFQPIHRTFHLVILEAQCDIPGRPRLDPQKIESAGIVVRRIVDASRRSTEPEDAAIDIGEDRMEGWLTDQDQQRHGWTPFHERTSEDWDPDVTRRRLPHGTGHPVLNQLLLAKRQRIAESVSPLFVAPPAICQALGKTILYGLIPVTSNDAARPPSGHSVPSYTQEEIQLLRAHLPPILQPETTFSVPRAGQRITYRAARDEAHGEYRRMTEFLGMVRQLAVEFDAFGISPQAVQVLEALNRIALIFPDGPQTVSRPAGDFLREVFHVLINGENADTDSPPSVLMPVEWPSITPAQNEAVFSAVLSVLEQHLAMVAPMEGRFNERGRRYRLRAFLRVNTKPECPPELIWSPYSVPFTIAPWYEANGATPPVPVALPDVDGGLLNKLKSLKPNVAFLVPESLMNTMMANSPKDFLEGSGGKKGASLGLDWICGFNIPIITLCAFIVFSIFLQLFNIIFWWLPFVKICIPFPKKR